jgi:glutamate N-acetyltransferase/amino-acid N-acetyltransferase
MAELAAGEFAIKAQEVAVASTGGIGAPLAIAAIESSISSLADSIRPGAAGHEAALEAIMTTDTRKKAAALEFEFGGKTARLGGMVKGSGMIHPNMATMLCFITTDAAIRRELLDRALRAAVRRSFNRVTVDGDTSTNDTIIIMANGEAGNPCVEAEGPEYALFAEALETLCVKLARAMARDGEGATRLLTVSLQGAASEEAAETLTRAVASSSLVKAACFGADANWGRVLCALGYAGVDFDPAGVDLRFASAAGEIRVWKAGAPIPFSEEEARRILSQEEIEIRIDLANTAGNTAGNTDGKATAWGCDLSYDYVKINGDYRS